MAQVKVNMQVFKNNFEVLYTMSRVEANILLDWVKTGQEIPRHLVDWALFVTGDNAPYRCAEGYAQVRPLISNT